MFLLILMWACVCVSFECNSHKNNKMNMYNKLYLGINAVKGGRPPHLDKLRKHKKHVSQSVEETLS